MRRYNLNEYSDETRRLFCFCPQPWQAFRSSHRRVAGPGAVAAIGPEQLLPVALAQRVERIGWGGRGGDGDRSFAALVQDDDVEFRVVLLDHVIVAVQYARDHAPERPRVSAVDFLIERDPRAVRHIERCIQRGEHVRDRGVAGVEANRRRVTADADGAGARHRRGTVTEIVEPRWRLAARFSAAGG